MKYTVYPEVFELNQEIEFGIIIGRHLTVSKSTASDQQALLTAQSTLRDKISPEAIRELPMLQPAVKYCKRPGSTRTNTPPRWKPC